MQSATPPLQEAASQLPSNSADRSTRHLHLVIASEISAVTRYYDRVIHWMPRSNDNGSLFANVEAPVKQLIERDEQFPDITSEQELRTAILVNGTFNHHFDIQDLLSSLKQKLSRTSRLVVILYNPYLSWLYKLANRLGVRKGELPTTFITRVDLQNLAAISGFDIVRQRQVGYSPWRLLGFGNVINRLFPVLPLVRWFALVSVVVLRPRISGSPPGISCVIPARDERGNIENAIKRLPNLGCRMEVIFVEGNSTDGTWEEIQRVAAHYGGVFDIKTLKQTGKGKADAVRLGFAHATQHLLTILDADLTMPPEMLTRFYRAYCEGHGDFVNGSRLTYPMEGEAMPFLNRLGNVFFAKMLTWVLDCRLGDSLCGTKLMARHDYQRMIAWRRDFGDFDPFGDFELLFPAAAMGLGIVDVPIRYLARTYGSTNIHRFRHGFQLLRMTSTGLFRIKLRRTSEASAK